MALRRARSIDRLHSLVDGNEIVLTADAPLALALNRRSRQPRLGDFALTPRNYAKQGLEVADRREMFHEIVRRTDLSFKTAATNLDRVLRCWEDTGQADAILDVDRYAGPAMEAVVDVLTDLESAYTLREDVTIPASVDVAVIDPDNLSALDRAVLPPEGDYEEIQPFAPAGGFELGEIDLLASTVAIVDTLEAHVTPANAGDVGIVLDPAGPLRPLVEATLEARSIPYHTDDALAEHPGLRSFLRALRMGTTRRRLRSGDVRGLVAELGLPTRRWEDARLVDRVSEERLGGLTRLWEGLEDRRLGEALDRFEEIAEAPRELGELLEALEIEQARVTSDLLDALEFYLQTYPVERDYSREGVLLASGRDNAYVDRPLVFHVGMGTGWAQSPRDDPWLDGEQRARREARDLARFERLLQSGRRRVYLAQDTRRGQPVTPCFHLHELLEGDFERFAQLPHRRRRPPEREAETGEGFAREPELVDVEPETPPTLSSGDLDRLTYCPRDWFMDQLVPTQETLPLRRGGLFHAFAELLGEHPGLADSTDTELVEPAVEIALDELADLLGPEEVDTQATELAVGFRAIARWLADNPPGEVPPDTYTDPPPDRRTEDNPFADALDVETEGTRTERWFRSQPLGVHGKVDLVHAPRRLVDWKSSRRTDSQPRTVRRARVDGSEAPPRLQPSVYLLHHRSALPEERLAFVLVDLLDERNAAIRGEAEAEDVTRRLVYHPRSFHEHVATRHAYDYITKSSNERQDVFEAVGYERYRRYVENNTIPRLEDKDEAEASGFADGLADLARRERGDYAKSERAARQAVRQLVTLREKSLFAGDLDELAAHVQATLDDLEGWLGSRFPVPEEADEDELAHRDLVLRDLEAHRSDVWRDADG